LRSPLGRELGVYSVTGWVRRADKFKDDGDWHVELTERADSPSDSCIVVEIPAPKYSARYASARAALDSLIGDRKVRRSGVLARPALARTPGRLLRRAASPRRAAERQDRRRARAL